MQGETLGMGGAYAGKWERVFAGSELGEGGDRANAGTGCEPGQRGTDLHVLENRGSIRRAELLGIQIN